jgi:hypothetical protein
MERDAEGGQKFPSFIDFIGILWASAAWLIPVPCLFWRRFKSKKWHSLSVCTTLSSAETVGGRSTEL